MKELDPLIFWYVFQEMLGAPLLWLLIILIAGGTLAFLFLLFKERTIIARRMVGAQAIGLLGGALALVVMAKVSSSGFTDAGGPADWFLIALVFGLGAGAAAGYITLVPVVGVAVSALLLHEALDTSLLIGGTLAVLGTAIMQRGRR